MGAEVNDVLRMDLIREASLRYIIVYTDIGDIAYFMISSLGFLKVELKV
jgi:hypothetical protein